MRVSVVALLILLMNVLLAGLINLPKDVGQDVPQGKLNSISFAPFREGQNPVKGIFPTETEIEEDLQLLEKKTHSIRTYASSEGSMPAVSQLAQKYGLNMIQGAWLDTIKAKNTLEIEALIRSANAYPEVVKRVIVGNEVLLRGELTAAELIPYIREVKRRVKQPVSYADVWSMYRNNPEIIKEVDFVTIHILPYWEDEPIAVDDAPAHIERMYKLVRQEVDKISPGKPILIGESGWPSNGRQRGFALPSVTNSAGFTRGLIKVAGDNGFDYNIVEAFNQPWKSNFEGVVGGSWGLYSSERQEVFPLVGKVYENPRWIAQLLTSMAIFIMVVLLMVKRVQTLSTPRLLSFLSLLQLAIVFFIAQSTHLWLSSFDEAQRIQTVVILALNLLMAILAAERSFTMLAQREDNPKLGIWLYTLYGVFFGWAIYSSYQLAFNGRYLSFPSFSLTMPVFSLLGLMLISLFFQKPGTRYNFTFRHLLGYSYNTVLLDKMLGCVLLIMGVAVIIGETNAFFISRDLILEHTDFTDRLSISLSYTLGNCQLLTWLLCLGLLALPLVLGGKHRIKE